jgi:hypothetical protein
MKPRDNFTFTVTVQSQHPKLKKKYKIQVSEMSSEYEFFVKMTPLLVVPPTGRSGTTATAALIISASANPILLLFLFVDCLLIPVIAPHTDRFMN